MTAKETAVSTQPTQEQRRVAAGQFERANQVISTGNFDYGVQLLMSCCKLDPANLIYRRELRKTEKAKFKNNLRGSRLAFLTTSASRTRLKAAKASRDHFKVLEYGEQVLARNPWDTGTQIDMADAADALGLLDVAVWTLEQARQKDPLDATVNRALARLYEKRGNFTQAIGLWEIVRKAAPRDIEAQHKAKDLAASDTIARGGYDAVVGVTSGERQAKRAADDSPAGKEEVPTSAGREPREIGLLKGRIQADPTAASNYIQLASLFRRLGKLDQAKQVLQGGLGPTGNDFDLSSELAELEIESYRRNLALIENKLKSQPQDEELRAHRARFLREINSLEINLYRQKAERQPTDMPSRLELGIRLLRAGQIDAAIGELQAARNDPRCRWRALMHLGYCFKDRNNWRLAQRNFEEAMQQLPATEENSRKELLFQIAQGCAQNGELAKAVDLAYELANLDFTYRDISRLLDEWQFKLQKA
jgi:tetratricopeptide (TPR) repeat protein